MPSLPLLVCILLMGLILGSDVVYPLRNSRVKLEKRKEMKSSQHERSYTFSDSFELDSGDSSQRELSSVPSQYYQVCDIVSMADGQFTIENQNQKYSSLSKPPSSLFGDIINDMGSIGTFRYDYTVEGAVEIEFNINKPNWSLQNKTTSSRNGVIQVWASTNTPRGNYNLWTLKINSFDDANTGTLYVTPRGCTLSSPCFPIFVSLRMLTCDNNSTSTASPTFPNGGTSEPTKMPIFRTPVPTKMPILNLGQPTGMPVIQTPKPTDMPTMTPTPFETNKPTVKPSNNPSRVPTANPTKVPTWSPSKNPSRTPTQTPTSAPTRSPSKKPTLSPSNRPTHAPTKAPTQSPTLKPTSSPSNKPTLSPTPSTKSPTLPTSIPSASPTIAAFTISPTTSNSTSTPTSLNTTSPTTMMPTSAPQVLSYCDSSFAGGPFHVEDTKVMFTPLGQPPFAVSGPLFLSDQSIIGTFNFYYKTDNTVTVSFSITAVGWGVQASLTSNSGTIQISASTSTPKRSPGSWTLRPELPAGTKIATFTLAPEGCNLFQICYPIYVALHLEVCYNAPTTSPTTKPTETFSPTSKPIGTLAPSRKPSKNPVRAPSKKPVPSPTSRPTKNPVQVPTKKPISNPTINPTSNPIQVPTKKPVAVPTLRPTKNPVRVPTKKPIAG